MENGYYAENPAKRKAPLVSNDLFTPRKRKSKGDLHSFGCFSDPRPWKLPAGEASGDSQQRQLKNGIAKAHSDTSVDNYEEESNIASGSDRADGPNLSTNFSSPDLPPQKARSRHRRTPAVDLQVRQPDPMLSTIHEVAAEPEAQSPVQVRAGNAQRAGAAASHSQHSYYLPQVHNASPPSSDVPSLVSSHGTSAELEMDDPPLPVLADEMEVGDPQLSMWTNEPSVRGLQGPLPITAALTKAECSHKPRQVQPQPAAAPHSRPEGSNAPRNPAVGPAKSQLGAGDTQHQSEMGLAQGQQTSPSLVSSHGSGDEMEVADARPTEPSEVDAAVGQIREGKWARVNDCENGGVQYRWQLCRRGWNVSCAPQGRDESIRRRELNAEAQDHDEFDPARLHEIDMDTC